MAKKKSKLPDNNIAYNRSAKHEFFIESNLEVGIALEGWEVKSLRQKNLQLKESYVFIKNNELWLSGANITPLQTASTHIKPEQTRVRKLLAHRHEIDRLMGMVDRKGYTLVAISAYWKHGKAKLDIGLGKGKKLHDKRASEKDRDWERDKGRLMKGRR